MKRLRWILGGMMLGYVVRWLAITWQELRGVDTRELAAWDPESGLRMRVRLTPEETAAAIERERAVELVG